MSGGRPRPERGEIGRIEQAIDEIVTWATRNDVHGETMKRAQCELTRTHLWVLARLDEAGAVRLSELALALGVEPSTLSPQVQRMEREGLVAREPDPNDGRASLLRLTKKGATLLRRLRKTRRTIFAELLDTWSDDERSQMAAHLARLAGALNTRAKTV